MLEAMMRCIERSRNLSYRPDTILVMVYLSHLLLLFIRLYGIGINELGKLAFTFHRD